MGTQNIGAKYQSISFDKPFIAEIKKHIEGKDQYRSIADFAREAIREKMQRDKNAETEKTIGRLAQEDLNYIVNTVVGQLKYGYDKIKKK